MTDDSDITLNNFIKEATDLLSASQNNLHRLVGQINQHLATASNQNGNAHIPSVADLHYLHQQTDHLIRQSQALVTFLDSNCEQKPASGYTLTGIQVLQRQEEERARTARDLEDTTAQLLANAIFELAAVKQLIDKEGETGKLIDGVNALQAELEQGLADLRFLIAELEPGATLGNFGLAAGLRRYLEKFQERTGIVATLQTQTVIEALPNTVEIAIFRVIQEALHNSQQHARATRVQVIISAENDILKFSIIDDGVGLDPNEAAPNRRRLGLVGMKDLADMLEGALKIKSDKNKGTQVTLTIPYPQL